MTSSSEVEARAALWLTRRDEPGWTDADQKALDAWLEDSPAHQASYWRLEEGWRAADRIGSLGLGEAVANARRHHPLRRWGSRAIAVSLIVLVARSPDLPPRMPEERSVDMRTPVGGHVVAPMADGSKIELNTGTHLRATVSREHREVWLDQGEAFFDVLHSPDHPFVVHAGSRTVTVLGTKFSVRRDRDEVTVAVLQGRVRIDGDASVQGARSSVVVSGDIAVARDTSTMVAASASDGVANLLSWRDGLLDLDRSTLAEAATELNRYNRDKIVIDDPALGRIRLGGVIRTDNVDGFVSLLRTAYGLNVERKGNTIRISS